MLIESSIVRNPAMRITAEPGHRNDDGALQLWPLAQLPRDLVPVHAGHRDVQKDDVRKKRPDGLQGGGAVIGDSYVMTAQS